MTWPSGPHECDGPWAPWWYADVHQSTGWNQQSKTSNDDSTTTSAASRRYRTLDPSYLPALHASYPAYDILRRLTTTYQQRGPPAAQIYEDPRNEHVLVWVGTTTTGCGLVPRHLARISPFDASVQGGDATWEGLRVYRDKILSLDKHLTRLVKSAKALGFYMDRPATAVHSKAQITEAIFQTLAANGMRDGAHMRLTLTRGEKCTSSMNPQFNVYGTTLIILPEWKPPCGATTYDNAKGIALITSTVRRNSPQTCDSKIHHNKYVRHESRIDECVYISRVLQPQQV